MKSLHSLAAAAFALAPLAAAVTYNTFDGPGFPACRNVAAVYNATSVDEVQSLVKGAIAAGQKVRASGKGHMWYDTMCSDDPNTVIIRTEEVNGISEFDLNAGTVELRHIVKNEGSDEWLAASTSLGLLGVIVRMKFKIYPDFKVYADQKT
nr:FAD/FMN-containing dehydrogenase [Colletotrichum truncatum]KAF6800864.1 FAD/FMN-containing dehydrogenase [Colletotrichum truncatum]